MEYLVHVDCVENLLRIHRSWNSAWLFVLVLSPCPCTTFVFATGIDIMCVYQCFFTPLTSFWQHTTFHFLTSTSKTRWCLTTLYLFALVLSPPPCPCTTFVFVTDMGIIFLPMFCTPLASFCQHTTCRIVGPKKTCLFWQFDNVLLVCFGSLLPVPALPSCTTGMGIIFICQCFYTSLASFC